MGTEPDASGFAAAFPLESGSQPFTPWPVTAPWPRSTTAPWPVTAPRPSALVCGTHLGAWGLPFVRMG